MEYTSSELLIENVTYVTWILAVQEQPRERWSADNNVHFVTYHYSPIVIPRYFTVEPIWSTCKHLRGKPVELLAVAT